MRIINSLLFDDSGKQVSYQGTPNKGGKYNPQYLVMHYTAVTQAKGSISWFLDKAAKASAHLLIDRDGSVTQFAPFDVVCWHAGESQWHGLTGMNKYAIGVELVNGGRLIKTGNNWICPVDKKGVSGSDVIIARHKNEHTDAAWQDYTEVQIEVAIKIGALLVQTYNLKDVVGHDDISPYRKSDPGPAFPMPSFRSRVMGRKDNVTEEYLTTTSVNIRSGAGSQFPSITEPLPSKTPVHILKHVGNWSFVEVSKEVHALNDLEGWIFSKYLSPG